MNRALEIKKKIDSFLLKQPAIGLLIIIALFVVGNVIQKVFLIFRNLGVFFLILNLIIILITEIIFELVSCYIIYLYTVQKPLFTLKNKYLTFVTSCFGIFYIKSVVGSLPDILLYGQNLNCISPINVILNFLGVRTALDYMKYVFDCFGLYSSIFGIPYAILTVVEGILYTISFLVNVAGVILLVLYDYKFKEYVEGDHLMDSNTENVETVTIVSDEENTEKESVDTEDVSSDDESVNEDVTVEKQTEGKLVEKSAVDLFIMSNNKYFSQDKILLVKNKLAKMTEEEFFVVNAMEFKDPTMITVLSVLAGGLGIDRFMIGDTGMGILKLLTGGCCGILTIIDWFTIGKKVKDYNFNKFMVM